MKKVLINVEERELRVAILEDDQLVELYIESLEGKSILNNIYKGRIEGVLPGLKAAFVNVGLEKNAFLHFDDVRDDLLWKKYNEMNPEIVEPQAVVEAVPVVPVAVSDVPLAEGEESEDEDGDPLKRKRRRGRRGGKKRLRDAEDTYTPGLPRGVSEDDLEDDDEEDEEIAPSVIEDFNLPVDEQVAPMVAITVADGTAPVQDRPQDANERRNERRDRRRERWEQKKLERQQRRLQGLPPQSSPHHASVAPQSSPQPQQQPGNYRMPQPAAAPQVSNWTPPPVRGSVPTRATANPYEVFSPYARSKWWVGGT